MRIVYPTAPKAVAVLQSQRLILECIVSGSAPPVAKWFKNGEELTAELSHQHQHNNLVFASVTRNDNGTYACAAQTEQGTVKSANYTVNVVGKKKRRNLSLSFILLQRFPKWGVRAHTKGDTSGHNYLFFNFLCYSENNQYFFSSVRISVLRNQIE